MAESSIGWNTNGTGDGLNSGYTQAQFTEWQRMLFAGLTGSDLSGVASDYLNELAVTGTASPVAVNTGGAIVYGFPYFNTASVNVAVPTPASNTRIDRIVLQVNWAAQTVRIARVAGAEGGVAPTLTQVANTTWQMSLAQVSITTGGVITVTDEREWLTTVGDGTISTQKLADNAVTQAKIADNSITNTKMADNAINTAELLNSAVTTAKIADANVTTAKIADANVTLAKLAADVVIGAQMMIIPLQGTATQSSGGTWVAIDAANAHAYFDADKLPSDATVKLGALVTANGTAGNVQVRLANLTNAAVITGSTATATSPGSTYTVALSSDFRANLPSGAKRWGVEIQNASGNGWFFYSAFLLVEW